MNTKQDDWEKEFDKRFVGITLLKSKDSGTGDFCPYSCLRDLPAEDFKAFIRHLLQQARQEGIEEAIGAVQMENVDMFSDTVANSEGAMIPSREDVAEEKGFNDAVDVLKAKIFELKKKEGK